MERERPEYLAALPKDRAGFPWMIVVGVALLAAMIGGGMIYLRTVQAWEQARQPRQHAIAKPQPRYDGGSDEWKAMSQAQRATRAVEDERLVRDMHLRAIREKRESLEVRSRDEATWKCVNGTPFRPIDGGGWENVHGVRC